MELYTFMPALRPSCMVEKKEALFPIEQYLSLIPGILTGTMAWNTLQIAPKQPAIDELKEQQQLGRIVSEVVRELEDGATQAMLNVCLPLP